MDMLEGLVLGALLAAIAAHFWRECAHILEALDRVERKIEGLASIVRQHDAST